MQPGRFDYYLGVPEPSWLNRPDGVPKFVSAARFARYRTGGDRWPVGAQVRYAIDSGAYIALNGTNKQVPWFADDDTYGGMVARYADNSGYPPDFCAPRDMPCEPNVRKITGLSVRDHQEMSTDSYLWLEREFPWLPWVPVLQGWEPDDYRVHERMYQDAGVDLAAAKRVGIGSICRRGHLPGIVEVIEQFAEDGYQLHGFGIKTTALPAIGHLLRSADSMAWSFHARKSKTRLNGCEHTGDCRNCYRYAAHWRGQVLASLAPEPTERTEETAVPTAVLPSLKFTKQSPGDGAVLGADVKPGSSIRCPISGCGRQAKMKRDGTVGAHKMFGSQNCDIVGLPLPADVLIRVMPASGPAVGGRVVPLIDVPWGTYGELKGLGPDGSRCTQTGYLTRLPRVFTGGYGENCKDRGVEILKVEMEMPPPIGVGGGYVISMCAALGATFRILEPPADRPLAKNLLGVGRRLPLRDLRPGDVIPAREIRWTLEEPDSPEVTVLADPKHLPDDRVELTVSVHGTTETRVGGGYTWVTISKPAPLNPAVADPRMPAAAQPAAVLNDDATLAGLRAEITREGQTTAGRTNATGAAQRYAEGVPLVRRNRKIDIALTFVCPVPTCGVMRDGWTTVRGLRAAWLRHGGGHAGFTAGWPDGDWPVEPEAEFELPAAGRGAVRQATVEVWAPKDDPYWDRLVARFEAEGRRMVQRGEVTDVRFDDGVGAARRFATALTDSGVPPTSVKVQVGDLVKQPELTIDLHGVEVGVWPTAEINLTTGTLNYPHGEISAADGAKLVGPVLAADEPESGRVAALIMRTDGSRGMAFGPFETPTAAHTWWQAPYNKMRGEDWLFCRLVPVPGEELDLNRWAEQLAGEARPEMDVAGGGNRVGLVGEPGDDVAEVEDANGNRWNHLPLGKSAKPQPRWRHAHLTLCWDALVEYNGPIFLPAHPTAPALVGAPDQLFDLDAWLAAVAVG